MSLLRRGFPTLLVRTTGLLLALCFGFGASATAQPGAAPSVADSAQATVLRSAVPFGQALTLRDIQREVGGLRLKPRAATDSAVTESQIGIIRLVVDETVSRAGALFYDLFYAQ